MDESTERRTQNKPEQRRRRTAVLESPNVHIYREENTNQSPNRKGESEKNPPNQTSHGAANLLSVGSVGPSSESKTWSENGKYRRRSQWDPAFATIAYKDFKFIQQPSTQNIAIVHYQDTKQSLTELVRLQGSQEKALDDSLQARAKSRANLLQGDQKKESDEEEEVEIVSKLTTNIIADVVEEEDEENERMVSKTEVLNEEEDEGRKVKETVEVETKEGKAEHSIQKEGSAKEDTPNQGSGSSLPPKGIDAALLKTILSGFGKKAEKKMASDGKGENLKMAQFAGLKRWKKKSTAKRTLRHFANNEEHLQFLKDKSQAASVEIPVPMKMLLLEEVYPIIKKTTIVYEKVLGKKHTMATQAHDKLEELTRMRERFEAL